MKLGVPTGAFAINPANDQRIPIWIADYVLSSYGTGAIMAVPGHDERDFEFAREFSLPIVDVVAPDVGFDASGFSSGGPLKEPGIAKNSESAKISLNGLKTHQAKAKITAWLEENGLGKQTINYKLRDWLFSRQRYWGEPFPIVWKRDAGGNLYHEAVPEKSLPVLPPELVDYKPTSDGQPPLARATDWVQLKSGAVRETNTMPQWAGSCWYYLRYLDAKNGRRFVSRETERYWMGSDRPAGMVPLIAPEDWHREVAQLVHRAFADGKRPPFSVEFAPVSERLAAMIRASCGAEVSGFSHALGVNAVRHAFNRHGVPGVEESRGNIAITAEDIERLPEMLADPDAVRFDEMPKPGHHRFVISKRVNGTVFVVVEVRPDAGSCRW